MVGELFYVNQRADTGVISKDQLKSTSCKHTEKPQKLPPILALVRRDQSR